MKKLFFLLLATPLIAAKPVVTQTVAIKQLDAIDHLISYTEEILANEKILREEINCFLALKESGEDSKKTLLEMSTLAYRICSTIEQYHLDYAFTTEFLEELEMFSSVFKKRQVP